MYKVSKGQKRDNTMQITKDIFDQVKPGEIFRTVTTRFQNIHDPMGTTLTFACVKGKTGQDWAIYAARAGSLPDDIARYGDKVTSNENIRSLSDCDEEVLALYRY